MCIDYKDKSVQELLKLIVLDGKKNREMILKNIDIQYHLCWMHILGKLTNDELIIISTYVVNNYSLLPIDHCIIGNFYFQIIVKHLKLILNHSEKMYSEKEMLCWGIFCHDQIADLPGHEPTVENLREYLNNTK